MLMRSAGHLATINPSITVLLFREHLLCERERKGEGPGEAVPCLTNWYLMPDKCGTRCPMNETIENVTPTSLLVQKHVLSSTMRIAFLPVYPIEWNTVLPRSRKFPMIPTHKRRSSTNVLAVGGSSIL